MADTKISAMTGATTPLGGTEEVPIVQSGANRKVSVANLTAGRSVSAASFVPTGSTVPANGMYLSAANTLSFATNSGQRMIIDDDGNVSIGGAISNAVNLYLLRNITGSPNSFGYLINSTVQSGVTSQAFGYKSILGTAAASFTNQVLAHFAAEQGTIGATSTVVVQVGFRSEATLIGASFNSGFTAENTAAVTAGRIAYGFLSNVNVATGGGTAWAFYGNGTAPSLFNGDMRFDKTITATATTGAQTINKNAGSVNFAAAATSLVVTNSRVTTASVIIATVATDDATMLSVKAVAAAGSFTLIANAAATAETRVNFLIIN